MAESTQRYSSLLCNELICLLAVVFSLVFVLIGISDCYKKYSLSSFDFKLVAVGASIFQSSLLSVFTPIVLAYR